MQAIILAAGLGSRLEQFNNGNPKALIKLDKAHLIDYQISMFRYFGIKDICIVLDALHLNNCSIFQVILNAWSGGS